MPLGDVVLGELPKLPALGAVEPNPPELLPKPPAGAEPNAEVPPDDEPNPPLDDPPKLG